MQQYILLNNYHVVFFWPTFPPMAKYDLWTAKPVAMITWITWLHLFTRSSASLSTFLGLSVHSSWSFRHAVPYAGTLFQCVSTCFLFIGFCQEQTERETTTLLRGIVFSSTLWVATVYLDSWVKIITGCR